MSIPEPKKTGSNPGLLFSSLLFDDPGMSREFEFGFEVEFE